MAHGADHARIRDCGDPGMEMVHADQLPDPAGALDFCLWLLVHNPVGLLSQRPMRLGGASPTLGLIILLISCLAPMIIGGLLGWWLHGRVERYGITGAFIPDFIHAWLEPK